MRPTVAKRLDGRKRCIRTQLVGMPIIRVPHTSANGFANETKRNRGDDARHRRRTAKPSPGQRDLPETPETGEARVVVLITQRQRVAVRSDAFRLANTGHMMGKASSTSRRPASFVTSPAVGTIAAYAAGIAAFAYALVSLYWALGGHGLISTVGGFAEQATRRGGAATVLLALAAAAAKVLGGVLALALVRPWGRAVPRIWLLITSAGASVLLVVYGGLNVLAGALVLSGVIRPSAGADRTALRWHVGVWDTWFLVWGILLAIATISYRRRTARRAPEAAS